MTASTSSPDIQASSGTHVFGMKVSVLFFVLALGWTLLLAGLCLWEHMEERASAMALARTECLSAYNRDVAYRLWATRHGGVYVPITETTPPNPYLFFVPERDIKTPSGRKLTLMAKSTNWQKSCMAAMDTSPA